MVFMKSYIIAILILVSIFSGCAALVDSPILYATMNITDNETGISIVDGHINMEQTPLLKVPKQDQTAEYPYMALQVYSNRSVVSYLSATEYHGTGTYTFAIPMKRVPQYNDTMAFEIRFFDGSAKSFNRAYFYARWRWNETE